MRTEVVLWSRGKQTQSIPVEIRAETTIVAAAAGRPAPDFVFANANDNAYGLVMLDDRSAAWLGAHIGEVPDTFLRAMLWGAMWDLVRDARLAPTQFIATALRELPAEQDEQIASGIVTRLSRATSSYLSAAPAGGPHRAGRGRSARRRVERTTRLRASEEPARRVHLARAHDRGDDATRRVARQRIDGGTAASPANALVDRHASDRARGAERRRAVRGGNASRHDRQRQAKRVRRRGGPFVRGRRRPNTSIDIFATRRSTRTGPPRAYARSTRPIKRRSRCPISYRRSTACRGFRRIAESSFSARGSAASSADTNRRRRS